MTKEIGSLILGTSSPSSSGFLGVGYFSLVNRFGRRANDEEWVDKEKVGKLFHRGDFCLLKNFVR